MSARRSLRRERYLFSSTKGDPQRLPTPSAAAKRRATTSATHHHGRRYSARHALPLHALPERQRSESPLRPRKDGSEGDLTPGEKLKASFEGWGGDRKFSCPTTSAAEFFALRYDTATFERKLIFKPGRLRGTPSRATASGWPSASRSAPPQRISSPASKNSRRKSRHKGPQYNGAT